MGSPMWVCARKRLCRIDQKSTTSNFSQHSASSERLLEEWSQFGKVYYERCGRHSTECDRCKLRRWSAGTEVRSDLLRSDGNQQRSWISFGVVQCDHQRDRRIRYQENSVGECTLMDNGVWIVIKRSFVCCRSDLAAKKFDIISIIPKMSIVGQYDLSMNILLLRAAGKGDFRLQLSK